MNSSTPLLPIKQEEEMYSSSQKLSNKIPCEQQEKRSVDHLKDTLVQLVMENQRLKTHLSHSQTNQQELMQMIIKLSHQVADLETENHRLKQQNHILPSFQELCHTNL